MSSHGKIRSIDMRLIDDLFEMGDGYVLNFSNKTFAEFFDDELGIDIDDSRYDVEGTSKAKRLRFFLKTCDPQVRIQTLLALWEYREVDRRRNPTEETIQDAEEEFYSLIERLGGKRPAEKKRASASQASKEIDLSLSMRKLRKRQLGLVVCLLVIADLHRMVLQPSVAVNELFAWMDLICTKCWTKTFRLQMLWPRK